MRMKNQKQIVAHARLVYKLYRMREKERERIEQEIEEIDREIVRLQKRKRELQKS